LSARIELDQASLSFRVYRNPSPALKEVVLDHLLGRKHVEDFFQFSAIKNLTLTINAGERVGVVGLNGAGKSTLLKMIAGIYPPDNGRIHVLGRMTPLIEVGTGFDLEMSGRENIYLNGALLAHSKDEMRLREKPIIEFAGLEEFIDMPIKYYSSGMLGRLAFSIATMIEPEILLVDEIFSTGDAQFVGKATERMLKLFDHSQIVMMVSHNTHQIMQLCNRVIVMKKGEVVADGDPQEMVEYYHDVIVGTEYSSSATS
jgi:ABC-type polysaccharide/polyol phosphate transport system ATPase subunit